MRPMKDSGVEWLGEVPEGWTVAPLKSVVNLNPESLGESTDSSLIINYIEIGDVAPPAGVNGYKLCAFGDSPSRARRLVQPGDVLISTVRTYLKAIGRVPARANDDPWVASTGFAALRPTRVNSRFLELALSADSFISRIQANSVGVSYPGIDASKLVRFQLAVPSEREQEKIVAFLDKETSQIDILILKKEQLIEKLLERRQALITQVVTKGLDPNVPMKDSGVEWLGEVPHAWRVVKLNSLFEIRPGFSFKSEDLDFAGDLQIVRMSDLNSDEKALYLDSTSVKFPESAFISDGDIVLGMTGDFRAILWGRGRAALNQRLAALRAEDLDVAKFAIYPLQIALTIAHDSMFSTTIKNLSLSQLRNIPVPLPPPGERNRILEELDREVGQINMLVEKTRKSIELLKERRQALITQVVTGKIDVRGFAGGNS